MQNIVLENINGKNKKMKLVVIVLIFIWLVSCKTNRMSTIRDNKIESDSNISKNNYLNRDTILQYKCGPFNQSIKAENLNWVHFDNNLGKCLLKNGFKGDNTANLQIAEIIRIVGIDGIDVFGKWPKFRGPEVFEALLSVGEDYGPAYDFDQNLIPHLTRSSAFAYRYYRLIENIGGKTLTEYESQLARAHKFKSKERLLPDYRINPEWQIEYDKLIYEGIKQAWEDGKIKLKPYEENY